jgi:hypothetical protein
VSDHSIMCTGIQNLTKAVYSPKSGSSHSGLQRCLSQSEHEPKPTRMGHLDRTRTSAKYEGDPTTINWRKEFDGLLGHCEAVTDTPRAYFGPELTAAYPEAKAAIVQRDFEAWERSHKPLFDGMWNPIYSILAFLDPQCVGRIRKNMLVITKGQMACAEQGGDEGEFASCLL